VKDVFSRFCFFIKQVSKDGTQLQNQLDKLEAYLACQKAKNQIFLCGNQASKHSTSFECCGYFIKNFINAI
jgi:hypothetical protein